MPAKVELQRAYILHRRPYRDTSLLLDLWTREFGRVALVARGVKRPRSPMQGVLQPFRPLLVSWSRRGELGTLTGAEADGPAAVLGGRLLMSALYLNELLMRLLERDDAHDLLFDAYGSAVAQLGVLAQGPADAATARQEQRILRVFESAMLRELGYGLVLDRDVATGSPIEAGRMYRYHVDQGPMPSGPESGGLVLSGSSLLSMQRGDWEDEQTLRDAKQLMRAAIDAHLAGRPLQSRELRQALERSRRE